MGLLGQVADSVFCVSLPRTVHISNWRLGLLRRLLELGMAMWIAADMFWDRAWIRSRRPSRSASSLWREPGDPALVEDSSVLHCTDVGSFKYRWSDLFVYSPTRCEALDASKMFRRTWSEVLIPTYVQDTWSWSGTGAACSSEAEDACTAAGGTYSARSEPCTCTKFDEYFVKNTELQRLTFVHGYEVVDKGVKFDRGSIRDDDLLTVILDQTGEPCPVGAPDGGGAGRSHWTRNESLAGIWGSVQEWLACAGLHLDQRSLKTANQMTASEEGVAMRVTGVDMVLDLDFQNARHRTVQHEGKTYGVACYVRVKASAEWVAENQVVAMPRDTLFQVSGGTQKAELERYGYYIVARLEVSGTFAYFDRTRLLVAIASSAVLLSLPATFMYWFSLYGLGLLSRVYATVSAQVLDIKKILPEIGADILTSCSTYRYLSDAAGKRELTTGVVDQQMQAAFADLRASGKLNQHELNLISATFYHAFDGDSSGQVRLEEFVRASMAGARLNIMDVVQFFDANRKVGFLEKVFSPSKEQEVTMRASRVFRQLSNIKPSVKVSPVYAIGSSSSDVSAS